MKTRKVNDDGRRWLTPWHFAVFAMGAVIGSILGGFYGAAYTSAAVIVTCWFTALMLVAFDRSRIRAPRSTAPGTALAIADACEWRRERYAGAAGGTPRSRCGAEPRRGAALALAHYRRRQERAAVARILSSALEASTIRRALRARVRCRISGAPTSDTSRNDIYDIALLTLLLRT